MITEKKALIVCMLACLLEAATNYLFILHYMSEIPGRMAAAGKYMKWALACGFIAFLLAWLGGYCFGVVQRGEIHATQALREYRQRTGIGAKLIVVGMTATEFSIADPDDAGMLDVVGFDTATPGIMSDFLGA